MAGMEMTQEEIDEISEAFGEAWDEFFGQEMFYVPFDPTTEKHPVYGESKRKKYLEDAKVSFKGTFREVPTEEVGEIAGNRMRNFAEVTIVTKSLRDNGINEIDTRSVIDIPDRDGKIRRYNILAREKKVQLINNFIFTRIRVVYDL